MRTRFSLLALLLISCSVFTSLAQPSDREVQEGRKRGRMLTELKWTPIHDIALRAGKGDYAKAGAPKKGILYSSAGEMDKFVPFDVSIYTFLTCVHNPYSLLYTENVNAKTPKSAYGFKYTGVKNSGAWMGCVCTKFSAFAAGMGVPYVSSEYDRLCREGILEKAEDQSAQGVRTLDLLWQKGHARAVTDVKRDPSGRVTGIEISESKSPNAVRKMYTCDQFEALKEKYKITVYRYTDRGLAGHAPMYDDPDPVVYNDAICTFAGDRACFKEGDLIVIHCFDRNYRTMELYKDDRLVAKVKLTKDMLVDNAKLGIQGGEEVDPGAYAVNLTDMNLKYGMYRACLAKGKKKSPSTSFEIINCDLKWNPSDRTLSYSSMNGTAVFMNTNRHTTSRLLTEDEVKTNTIQVGDPGPKVTYLKVHFQGKYGRAARSIDIK